MSFLRLLATTFLLLVPSPLYALVPTYTNLGSPAQTFGVQEQFLLNANALAQDESVANLPTPTGTIFFTVDGVLVGSPFPISAAADPRIANGQGLLSFAQPGTYSLVAHYSGDSYYAPSTSTYSYDVNIVTDPVRFGFQAATTSLAFPAGATTGNTDLVSLVDINGFYGTEQYACAVTEDPNEPLAQFPATCSVPPHFLPDGSIGFSLTITTTPTTTVTAAGNSLSRSLVIPALALLVCTPLGVRRRWISASVVMLCASTLTLTACGGGRSSMSPSPPQTTYVESSAGHYVVHLTGIGYDDLTGEITLARPTDIAVTVQ